MPLRSRRLQLDFGRRLVPLARAYRRQLDRSLAGLSLSHSTALTVMVLGRMGEGVRQGALAEELGMESPSLVPLLDQIERAGLAERTTDPTDKRAKIICLTDAGRALAAEAEIQSAEARAALFADVEEQDLRTALKVLDQLDAALSLASQQG